METGECSRADALLGGPAHRRGAGLNPANRFEKVRLHVLGEELDRQAAERVAAIENGEAEDKLRRVPVQILPDRTKTIINKVTALSDVPFDYTLNPYRGCEHGCIYCFARPYHEYLGMSCGLDFETKIMAKHDAPELLRRELALPKWNGEPIVMSAITDIYQPIEHELRIARRCLEILAECDQPVGTMTKGALILRDLDLWQKMCSRGVGRVTVTLVTLDAELAKKLEPRATLPAGRLRMIRELTAAGIDVSVNVAPVIPGLTDREVPRLLEAVADAGAKHAIWVTLRLPWQLKALFMDWLERFTPPEQAKHVESLLRQGHNGKLYDASTLQRRRGRGVLSENLATVFDTFRRKYKLDHKFPPLRRDRFRKPLPGGQMALF